MSGFAAMEELEDFLEFANGYDVAQEEQLQHSQAEV